MKEELEVIPSSGNVFADLELSNADEELAKAELAFLIRKRIRELSLSQSQAARLLGTDQTNILDLTSGKIAGFRYDRLFQYLNRLGCDIRMVVEKGSHPETPGTVTVFSR